MSIAVEAEESPVVDSEAGAGTGSRRLSLREMLFHGSTWTMIEYGGSQVLRLASNLILALFLDPAAYGVMGIIMLFTQALDMFSDIGIGPSIIQHQRGAEKSFLNTAWTMQVVRGFAISAVAAIISYPVSVIYHQPMLAYALPVAGLAGVIGGFNSANLYLLNREVRLARLAFINLATQVVSIAVTILFAYLVITYGSGSPDEKLDPVYGAWALIAGGLFSTLLKLAASHVFCPGPRSRFEWDSTVTRDIFHFGKWILLSTLFGFLASRGDQLILGWYLPTAEFGLYFVAVTLSGSLVNGMHTIAGRVLFPVYARLAEQGPDRLRHQTFRMRAILMILSVPPVCVLAVWGQDIVNLIYRPIYHDAGYMLQILSMGAVVSVIGSTIGPVLLAVGDSYRFMLMQGARTVIMCCTMAIGGYLGQTSGIEKGAQIGVVIGVALPELFLYPILVWSVRRYGVWLPKLDLAGFVFAIVFIGLGLAL